MVTEILKNYRVYHIFAVMCILASGMIITNLVYATRAVFSSSISGKPNKHEVQLKHGNEFLDNGRDGSIYHQSQTLDKHSFPDTQNEKSEWKILLFADVHFLKKRDEFSELKTILKRHDGISYKGTISCHDHNGTISLTAGSNLKLLDNQDATVFGLSPYSLATHVNEFEALSYRYKYQTWIFFGLEPPLRMNKWIKGLGAFKVDYTWSYLSSADIHMPYAHLEPRTTGGRNVYENVAKTKTKLVAWMGNNCRDDVFWPMMSFIEKLDSVIGVDTYGNCGDIKCSAENCTKLMSRYKFHLALEYAECDEYTTEKFWVTSLSNNVVPIVYGPPKKDYLKYAPRYSFIHVSDFQNITILADFIKLLDKNDELYNKFFKWRRTGRIKSVYPVLKSSSFCDLIPTLKNKSNRVTTTRKALSLGSWFKSCRNTSNIPLGLF